MKQVTAIFILLLTFFVTHSAYTQPDSTFHIYLCFGQSNMQGAVRPEPQDTLANDRFRMMAAMDCPDLDREMGKWYRAVPPLASCNAGLSPADYFGRQMIKHLPEEISVGVINVAVGGCRIELFDKENYESYVKTAPGWMMNWINEYGGNPYGRLVELAKIAQKDGVIKGILLHQGESNTGDQEWPQKVKSVYDNLISDLGLDPGEVPLLAGELVGADENGACASMNEIIHELPGVIPNAYIIPSDGCEAIGDRLHFSASGYRKLGRRYAGQMLDILKIEQPENELTAQSPDGKLSVSVATRNGKPVYTMSYDNEQFLLDSPLGLNTNVGDFTTHMHLKDSLSTRLVTDSYTLATAKQHHISYEAKEAVFTFEKDGESAFDVIFRISNHDVAFRYHVYQQGARKSCVIREENTGFRFSEDTHSFLSPMMRAMTGFARTAPSYESGYEADKPIKENNSPQGYVFPGLFHTRDLWVLVSETGVRSLYPASHLSAYDSGIFSIDFPAMEQNNGFGSNTAQIGLPGYTPWRTVTVGKSLKPVVETTVAFDVVSPLYEPATEYKYGRGTWSWIIWQDPSMNYEDQVKYIDLASALNFEYILIDAWWDEKIGYERMKELIGYAASKNVSVFLWYNSNGITSDAFMTPMHKMNTSIERKKEMNWLSDAGVKGIKVDFFGGDKQETMRLYEDILSDANDAGLMVEFHGATLPRGWERMFPNFVGSEAVLASEMLVFVEDVRKKEAFYATLHPFIRNAVASMEFGGVILNNYLNKGNEKGQERLTSDVFQLATAVLFQNPVQFFALTPNNLNDAPEWAINFMKDVPTTWDETVFIDGDPGKYVLLARRHGTKWYVAGVNAQDQTVNMTFNASMFEAGDNLILYHDSEDLTGSTGEMKLKKSKEITITIPQNGGVLITN